MSQLENVEQDQSLKDIPSQLKSIELDYIKVSRIYYLLLTLAVCGPLGFIAFLQRDEFVLPSIFFAVLLFFVFLTIYFPKKEYLHTKYGLINDVFYVQEGIWFKKRVAVAQNRIQHTDVSQGPVARRYDLATLTIHTAGMAEANIKVPGLKHADAVAMRDYLIHLNKQLLSSMQGDNKGVSVTSLTPDENCMATSVLALRPVQIHSEEE